MRIEVIFWRSEKAETSIDRKINAFAQEAVSTIERILFNGAAKDEEMEIAMEYLEKRTNLEVCRVLEGLRYKEGISPYGIASLYETIAQVIPAFIQRKAEVSDSKKKYRFKLIEYSAMNFASVFGLAYLGMKIYEYATQKQIVLPAPINFENPAVLPLLISSAATLLFWKLKNAGIKNFLYRDSVLYGLPPYQRLGHIKLREITEKRIVEAYFKNATQT